ncbi:hypothetical protein B0H13DRAFT_1861391 [Mycena leptocephala]|nr:hypothetical protein B0H13DRAFT_1861391 [Mycena leptocephala]
MLFSKTLPNGLARTPRMGLLLKSYKQPIFWPIWMDMASVQRIYSESSTLPNLYASGQTAPIGCLSHDGTDPTGSQDSLVPYGAPMGCLYPGGLADVVFPLANNSATVLHSQDPDLGPGVACGQWYPPASPSFGFGASPGPDSSVVDASPAPLPVIGEVGPHSDTSRAWIIGNGLALSIFIELAIWIAWQDVGTAGLPTGHATWLPMSQQFLFLALIPRSQDRELWLLWLGRAFLAECVSGQKPVRRHVPQDIMRTDTLESDDGLSDPCSGDGYIETSPTKFAPKFNPKQTPNKDYQIEVNHAVIPPSPDSDKSIRWPPPVWNL